MTTSALRCPAPDCTGDLLDGYCDLCGTARPAEQPAPRPTRRFRRFRRRTRPTRALPPT
ncbi:hypothetical protein [Actinomadura atramentaria]|uniref:hypothetical protein n=1 Tax=Actinomadura atramentaria TaxID=1990 RepID=UPI00039B82CA|nr:hypothetical protein [Actinomadura atramentaria]